MFEKLFEADEKILAKHDPETWIRSFPDKRTEDTLLRKLTLAERACYFLSSYYHEVKEQLSKNASRKDLEDPKSAFSIKVIQAHYRAELYRQMLWALANSDPAIAVTPEVAVAKVYGEAVFVRVGTIQAPRGRRLTLVS